MATVSRRPSSTLQTKKSIPTHLSLTEQSKTTKKIVDPSEKRLNHIRIHILNNKIHRKLTHGEPTLVFDNFLYLGGLRSLQDKVSSIFFFLIFFRFI
jgi:hypothetical protein